MKNPPILIAVIGFFGALAGFGYIFFGLRVLGFDWFGALGDLPAYDHVGIWGWLAIAAGILWILVAVGLVALQPWAWLTAIIIAGISLLGAVLGLPPVSRHGGRLRHGGHARDPRAVPNSTGVKVAFGVQ